MLSVRPPMSTERPICFSTRRSRHAPMCSYKAAPTSTTVTSTATSRAPMRTRRYAAFQASLGMNVLSRTPDEKASPHECGWPNQEDHRRPNGSWYRHRRQDKYGATRDDHVSRRSVNPNPKRAVRKCKARADADREVWASSGEEVPDADHRE